MGETVAGLGVFMNSLRQKAGPTVCPHDVYYRSTRGFSREVRCFCFSSAVNGFTTDGSEGARNFVVVV